MRSILLFIIGFLSGMIFQKLPDFEDKEGEE